MAPSQPKSNLDGDVDLANYDAKEAAREADLATFQAKLATGAASRHPEDLTLAAAAEAAQTAATKAQTDSDVARSRAATLLEEMETAMAEADAAAQASGERAAPAEEEAAEDIPGLEEAPPEGLSEDAILLTEAQREVNLVLISPADPALDYVPPPELRTGWAFSESEITSAFLEAIAAEGLVAEDFQGRLVARYNRLNNFVAYASDELGSSARSSKRQRPSWNAKPISSSTLSTPGRRSRERRRG